jgi:diaminohydroxyphosphoribosylaminopyrimidine deaminase/5-amino-6-(5-phosphoribosylamino)uracil reductase
LPNFESDSTQIHSRWIRRCLELAARAAGQTAPNPMVGAVIIKAGLVVGEGFHPGAGHPHAEVFALRQAGDHARGATLYVNLEPCNHFGRTPPCTEAIIEAGIERVVVGMVDPDPRVAGSGIERLRGADIDVVVGVEAAACQQLNEAFIHRILHQRPLGILKYAMTMDGKIATTTGHSSWVTGPVARASVHQLRAKCDAVIVGGNTVRRDNPRLTTHGHSDHNPYRVVMSRQLDLPLEANLWDVQHAPTLVFTTPEANPENQKHLQQAGVNIITLEILSPKTVSAWLYNQGCSCLLWECGGDLASEAFKDGVIDKIWAFIAPKIIGGKTAPTPVGDLGLTQMTQALPIERLTWRSMGEDLLIEGYLAPRPQATAPKPEDKFSPG